MYQNIAINNDCEKTGCAKSVGNRKLSFQKMRPCGRETPPSLASSPHMRKDGTSSKNINVIPFKNKLENNSHKIESLTVGSDYEPDNTITRDEIISRRKLKVAARKNVKKLENRSLKLNKENPGFTLQLASEDFPTLNELKTKKRINLSKQEMPTDVDKEFSEESSIVSENKNIKTLEKSWKPKVKDPIHIDISQAIIIKNEKQKPVLKKLEPPTSRNILVGNILDSDNPTRKKGKVRPEKVQKPSKLKSHILNERKKKWADATDSNFEVDECSQSENVEIVGQPCNRVNQADENILTDIYGMANSVITDSEIKQIENNQNVIPSNVHSRRFREYCTNCLTEEVVSSVCVLLEKVAYFQDRMYAREPIKASAKRRYVAGINQVSKYLQVKKVKLLVIAPDLERNPGHGGLDEKVQYFKEEAESQSIPCVFGPNRKRLGKAVKKNTLVSCVAVLSYEGAEEQFTEVLKALHDSSKKYLGLIGSLLEDNDMENVQDKHAKAEEKYVNECDVTFSLLATLREELPAADRLMSAIQHSALAEEQL